VDQVVRIGAGGFQEPAGRLRELVGGEDGWILVRPDGHIAGTGRDSSGLAEVVRQGLGRRD
jgi:hypothetical protein